MPRYRRKRGRYRGGSSKGRDVRVYTLRGRRGRVNYVGITNNPRRRAAQHRRDGKEARLRVETGGMSRKAARRSESARLASHRRRHGGRNPRYNQTKSGGPKF